jgi:hypothetical protein
LVRPCCGIWPDSSPSWISSPNASARRWCQVRSSAGAAPRQGFDGGGEGLGGGFVDHGVDLDQVPDGDQVEPPTGQRVEQPTVAVGRLGVDQVGGGGADLVRRRLSGEVDKDGLVACEPVGVQPRGGLGPDDRGGVLAADRALRQRR